MYQWAFVLYLRVPFQEVPLSWLQIHRLLPYSLHNSLSLEFLLHRVLLKLSLIKFSASPMLLSCFSEFETVQAAIERSTDLEQPQEKNVYW